MKNFLHVTMLAICAIFMVANVSAQVITAERASEIANKFFANGKQKSAAFRSTNATLTQSIDSRAVTGESNDAPTFHILTGADGKGFVIVSGEEIENPIIGYSFDGTIDTSNLPDGFVDYITDIDAQVKALRKYNAENPQKAAAARSAMQKVADFEYNATTMGNIVKNLNTAPWGQSTPFNNLCKTTDGQTALTGCGPTAFAILCYYYKWPASGVGTVTHQGTGENMELGHEYDYASMRNDNYQSGYNEAEANAVAVLMRDLGWANLVAYGTGATSFGETAQHMVDHFRFKSVRPVDHGASLAVVRSTLGNDTQWKTYIKNNLNAGYPIPYASTTDSSNSARHIYILDGYTDNDYYHFNWGWSGNGNGWFTLDNMVPDNTSNYSNSHKAYYIIPDATTYTVTATVNDSNMGTVSINGGTAGSTATADLFSGSTATLTAHPAQGYALASWTKNGVVVGSRNTIEVTVGTDANDYIANFDDEANVTIVKDYTISSTTGELTNDGTSATKFSQWASTEQPVLKLNATCGETAANAMSVVNDVLQLYAYDYDKANGYTYTINAPDGYLITSYSFTYYMSSNFTITVSNGTTTQTASKSDQTLSASGLSTASTSFTLTGAAANNLVKVRSFTVTIQKEGATPPPTQYTITATANPGTAGSVTGGGTFTEGASVTLTATPNSGYEFVNWTKGGIEVSTSATYSFTANATAEYVAHFQAAATTFAVTTAANPAAGGTATFAEGTGQATTSATVASGTGVTLYAVANDGYRFVNWTKGGMEVSTNTTHDVTITEASDFVANFEEEATATEYPTPTGNTYTNNYLTSITTTGGDTNIDYSANAHPGQSLVVVPGKVQLEKGESFTMNLVAYSLGEGSSSVTREDMRYCHASLFTDFDQDFTFEASPVQTWGVTEPSGTKPYAGGNSNVYGNYDLVMNITHTITVPDDAPTGESHVRMIYTNAWTDWPANGTAELNKGIVYDIPVEVVEASNEQTLNVTYSGATWNNEASNWWVSVVTNTTPAVTVKTTDGTPKIGYSTFNEVRHPYLLDGNSFTISVPANCKITGYRLGYKAHNLVSKSVTYTNGKQSTGTITIAQSNEENTLTVTGLDNNEISFSVEDQSSQAGFIIKSLEITYVENEFEPAMFKAEIEGWRNDNPNTHLGTITIGGTAMKLTPAHQTASELTMPVVEGTALAFTRKYRGFEFNGFYIGSTSLGQNPTLTAENVAAIDENNPLIAKFTATDDATLFYDDDEFSYRIPAIAKTGNGMLVAVSDYRHNLDDIGRDNHGTGTKRVDLVMRTSTDNGATWSETKTIAAGDNNMVGSYQRAYGDAAIAAVGQNIVVMAAAGDVVYTAGTTSSPNKMARIYSTDNGATWTIEEMTTKMYSQSTSLIPSGGSAFFGSGKLAVDLNFNGTGNARIYGALLVRIGTDGYNNFGVFSDDLGATWKILGGDNTNPVAKGDEPKVEILPNGQILLSARRGGGRVFRVFTYGDDKANGAGSWGDAAVNGCDNGGSNATNGEIICLDAKRPNGKPTKILLQSQPKGGSGQYDRRDVTIWYKEVSADETYTSATIASDWTMGKQVSTQLSAYSAMCLQANGEIALFFEEAPCYGNDYTKGYSMVYVPLTIEEITNDNFLNPNAVVETVTVDVTLTDEQGNTYTHQFDYLPGDAAAIDAALKAAYPFISELGEGNLQGSDTYYTYTNTVTLPFKVSNANTTVWHNIYWPANGTSQGQFYPIYMMANADNATNVAKITEQVHYGNSQYNTYNYADKLGWAVYNVNNSFTFKFKNKLTGKFMAVNGVVSNGNASNVIFTDEAGATVFTLTKNPGTNDTWKGDYAITSVYDSTTGYVCNTSAGYADATNYTSNTHPGAWAKIVESPDYWTIYEKLLADINNFGAGDGKYTENDAINSIDKDALSTMLFSDLTAQATAVQNVKDSYTEITLTVPAVNDIVPGSVKILDELVSHKFVPKGNVTIQAMPAAGYRFVNWTRPAAAASAAARTAEARNSDVVSTDNPYTVTVSEALSLEANFEQIVVNATLTDAEGNTYEIQVSGFTAEITKDAVAEKLRETYPYITLGTTDQEGDVIDFGVLNIDGTAYTYTNMVELPFRVTNTTYIWHNIYYPSNSNNNPNYIAALNEDEIVDMAASAEYAYGDNPTYNTRAGNPKISWAIYNVNNNFEFIFKNAFTQKYIKVESVATGNTQNVEFVENAEDATTFTLLKDADLYNGDYALVAKVDDATGYLCATSSNKNYVTHFDRTNHQGAWVKIVEAPDYWTIYEKLLADINNFGAGDGKYIITDEISVINNAIANNSDNITFNALNAYGLTMEEAINNWPAVRLTINPAEGGTTNINGEENVVHKYVPNDYALPLAAVPAEGYHFVSWTGTNYESTDAATTITISGEKDDVIELTANFAINTYTINVTAEGNGVANTNAATVEHGGEVTLTAVANDGYEFAGWYNGEEFVSAEATYTFTVTSDINYTARFNEVSTGTVAIHITVASTDGTTVTNAEDGNVKAIINNIGQEWATDADFVVGADVELVASSDYDQKAYLFDGWYKNDVLVSKDLGIIVKATEAATYQARFFRGCVVIGEPKSNIIGYVTKITLPDGTSLGYDASNRAVVKKGTEVKINTWLSNGYETTWKDENDNIVGNEQNLVITIEKDVTYTATFEPASYDLTVRANDDNYGTVSATSGTSTGTSIKVGYNMEATITATANTGYYFVNWTKGTDVVSESATYTIPGIENVEDMVDVEYIANFLPVENATAGVYYRIAYDFPAPAAAGAARAVGDVQTLTISFANGSFSDASNDGKRAKIWTSNSNSPTVTLTATSNGIQYRNICKVSDGVSPLNLSLEAHPYNNSQELTADNGTTFTIAVDNEDYKITAYSISYNPYSNGYIDGHNNNQLAESGLNVSNVSFTVKGTGTSSAVDIQSFTVTIQQVGGDGESGSETPEPEPTPANRYYMQSVACGVSGGNNLQNALKMTQETGAASIFYYADSKLLSYDKGTYIKEDGGTRGLQAVGTSGNVTINTAGETSTIAAPSYMHANSVTSGTNTTYFIDHCGSNTGTAAHANHNFVLEEVTTLPVTISAALHATFYAPVAVVIPDGVKAYVLKEKNITAGSYVTMTLLSNGVIPANTGVILKSEEAKKYDFDIVDPEEDIDEARVEAIGNVLEGTVAKSYVNKDAYILANKNGKIGMYPLSNNSYLTGGTTATFTNNSHKAYLPVEGNFAQLLQQGVGFRFIFDDETTEIENVKGIETGNTIYDLQGRKLIEITEPGIYIVNGKKIFVK